MRIAFNPSTVAALIAPPNNKDITFDLRGHNIFARGVKFCGTDTNTWRDIKINNVSIDSNILDLRDGDNTTLTNINGVVTINSTWRPVVDNLTSDSTTSSLSANQGRVLKALIDGKSDSGHTHDDRYLKLTGGTMASNALITFADSGSWDTDKGPQGARGGLYWTGQSDYAKLYAEETAGDNLDLVIQFGDDNSNGLSIRNASNVQTSYISAGGVITTGTFKGNLDWSYITNKPATATRWPSWDEIANKPNTFTPSDHNHDGRYVYNYGGTQMDGASINKNALGMATNSGITEDWWHILQAAWNGEYRWNSQIAFPTQNRNGMYYRSGLDDNTAWGSWIKLLDIGNSYVTGGKGVINGTTITQVDNATNADTVDNYHISDESRQVYRNYYIVDNPAGAWILIKLPAWNANNEIVAINGYGDNRQAHCVVHCGSRYQGLWGYQSEYNGIVVTKIRWKGVDSGKFAIVALIDGGITTLTIKATNFLEISKTTEDNAAFAINSNFFSSGGVFHGNVDWDNVTGKPSSYTPSAHTHSWTSITDKIVAENEFNIVNAGFNSDMYFNYLPINDRNSTAYINSYIFGNGHQGLALVQASGFVKTGSSSSYVLLGDGGHKAESSLRVEYASSAGNAETLGGMPKNYGQAPFGTIPCIGNDGVMEIGRYIDFHYDNSGSYDFSTRLQASDNNRNVVTLPSESGTLALTSYGGDYNHPIFLGCLNLDHGNDGTISSSFYCLGYSVSFTYTRGGNYCRIYIPDTSYQTFYIRAAIASVNYSGGGMDTWVGNHRGTGAWWLHCYASGWNEVRVKGFCQRNSNNDSWWGGNPLWSGNEGANKITVCIFGYVTFK